MKKLLTIFIVIGSGLCTASPDSDICAEHYNDIYSNTSEETINKIVEHCGSLANAGDPEAQYKYGVALTLPRGDIPPNFEAGKRWMILSAENGYGYAQFYMAAMYKYGSKAEVEQSVKWYESAAKKGVKPAALELAEMYEKGIGVEVNGKKAVYWYEYALENHDLVNAQLALIRIYTDGIPGIRKDPKKVDSLKDYFKNGGCPNKSLNQDAPLRRAC